MKALLLFVKERKRVNRWHRELVCGGKDFSASFTVWEQKKRQTVRLMGMAIFRQE